jgi:hypothetical protein
LITSASLPRLARIVETFSDLGVRAFLFWLFSRDGFAGDELRELLPDLREVAPHLEAAFDAARARRVAAYSLHTPPCVLGARYRKFYRHSGTLRVLVVPPGGPPFMAEESPMEGGAYVPGCARCVERKRCLGPRADYLAVHGAAAFVPLGRGKPARPDRAVRERAGRPGKRRSSAVR